MPKKAIYKIKSKGEHALDTVITKSNFDLDFTLGEIQSNVDKIQKMKVEMSSKARLDEATMTNIEGTMPEIKDIKDEVLKVYYIYAKAKFFVEEVKNQIKHLDEVVAEEQKALDEIKAQTGITLDGQ
jgi:hypothetical protein